VMNNTDSPTTGDEQYGPTKNRWWTIRTHQQPVMNNTDPPKTGDEQYGPTKNRWWTKLSASLFCFFCHRNLTSNIRGRDRVVVGLSTTYVISSYRH
jgi:hypothetical protein